MTGERPAARVWSDGRETKETLTKPVMVCPANDVTIGTDMSAYGIQTILPTGAVGTKSPKPNSAISMIRTIATVT